MPDPYGPNLVTNPSVETDLVGWDVYGSTLTRTSEVTAYDGTYVTKVTFASGPDYGTSLLVPSLVPGQGEKFQGRIACRGVGTTVGQTVSITQQVRGGGGGSQNGVARSIVLTTSFQVSEWSELTVSAADQTELVLFALLNGVGVSGDAFYCDYAEVRRWTNAASAAWLTA